MERESPLQGDVLDSIFSHVPTIDLLAALHVSRSWRRGALSLIYRRQHRPWLLIHLLSRRRRCSGLSTAYDPHSHSWHTLAHMNPPPHITCPFLPLALPLQPLATTWSLLPPPFIHRQDALVALVGRRIILAGGVCELGDRTCAVESLSLDSASFEWENCEPMPESLRESAAATWLAVATSNSRYVLERGAADAGRLAWFDLATGRWSPVRPVQLGSEVERISAIGMGPAAVDGEDRLVVVGLMDCGALGIWELQPDILETRKIGSLPAEAVVLIAGEEEEGLPAVGFSNVGGSGFFYNLEGRGEVFVCEFGDGNWSWEKIGWPPTVEKDPTDMVIFQCGEPAMEDLTSVYRRRERS